MAWLSSWRATIVEACTFFWYHRSARAGRPTDRATEDVYQIFGLALLPVGIVHSLDVPCPLAAWPLAAPARGTLRRSDEWRIGCLLVGAQPPKPA